MTSEERTEKAREIRVPFLFPYLRQRKEEIYKLEYFYSQWIQKTFSNPK